VEHCSILKNRHFAPSYDWQTPKNGSDSQKHVKTMFQSLIFFSKSTVISPFLHCNGKLNFQGFQRCQKTLKLTIFLKSYIGRNVKLSVKFQKFGCYFLPESRVLVLKTLKCSIFNFKKIGASKIKIK